jgi:hypothetical protein
LKLTSAPVVTSTTDGNKLSKLRKKIEKIEKIENREKMLLRPELASASPGSGEGASRLQP